MDRNGSFALFLCLVLALGALLGLGYYAIMIGGGFKVEEGRSIRDDFDRAERWHEIRR